MPEWLSAYAFPIDAAREKAHAKWKDWVKAQETPAKK
jgi:hypothetical protein